MHLGLINWSSVNCLQLDQLTGVTQLSVRACTVPMMLNGFVIKTFR